MAIETENHIEMKELLRKSGISSFDLHNWVRRGFLPKACARINGNGPGSTFYYPAWAVERASDIRRLKSQGYTFYVIRRILAGEKVKERCSARTEARRNKRGY